MRLFIALDLKEGIKDRLETASSRAKKSRSNR